jgi:hypothetical protein
MPIVASTVIATITINSIISFYILLTVHLDVILVNDQLHAIF